MVVEWADLDVHNAAVPAIFVGLAPLTPDDYADVMATGLASMHIYMGPWANVNVDTVSFRDLQSRFVTLSSM